MKIVDLTGQQFTYLTVIRMAGKQGNETLWECECKCGKLHYATTSNLKKGHVKSCGCLKKETSIVNGKNTAKDITDKRFGRLTAISPTDERKGTNIVWLCKCDCGNTVYTTAINLIRGDTQSCGCIKDETFKIAVEKAGFIESTCVSALKSKKISAANTSGTRGVSFVKSTGKWLAYINFKKKRYNLGKYVHIEDAIKARKEAEKKIYGEFLEWYDQEYKNKGGK